VPTCGGKGTTRFSSLAEGDFCDDAGSAAVAVPRHRFCFCFCGSVGGGGGRGGGGHWSGALMLLW